MLFKKRIKELITYYPVTLIFILICSVIALLNLVIFKQINFSNASVVLFGGIDQTLIHEGEWWRLFTYAFGHMSIIHFVINMIFIYILSRSIERLYGSKLFLLYFCLMTIGAGICVYYFYEEAIAIAGSSGPGFGFIGVLTFLVVRYPTKMSAYDRQFTLYALLFGVISTFTVPGIAVSGHIGGFISGFLVALIHSVFQKTDEKKQNNFEAHEEES